MSASGSLQILEYAVLDDDAEKILDKQGMNVTIRRDMGSDIDAACGQMRQNYMNEETK